MEAVKQIRNNATIPLNFTGKIEVAPGELEFRLEGDRAGRSLDYRVRFTTFIKHARRIRPEARVSLIFTAAGELDSIRRDHGEFRALSLQNGIMEGTIEGIDDPENVRLRMIVVDPDTNRIRAETRKSRPDTPPVLKPGEKATVSDSHRQAEGERSGMLDFRERTQVLPFKLDLQAKTPILYVSKSIGKREVERNRPLMLTLLQSVFVEIVSEMVFHPEQCEGQRWFQAWKIIAASHSPDGTWESLVDGYSPGESDPGDMKQRIMDAAESFIARLPSEGGAAAEQEEW